MDPPRISNEQREALLGCLAEALERMVDTSCLEMAPLWIEATRQQRKPLGGPESMALGFTPSRRYFELSKGVRSRYRALATWRHACLVENAVEQVDDDDFRRALEVVYFTPYPDNAPPYAWSSRASDAPEARQFPSPTSLKNWAKEGCYQTIQALLRRVGELERTGTWYDEVRADLMRTGCRKTVRDVLKLEDHEWPAERS